MSKQRVHILEDPGHPRRSRLRLGRRGRDAQQPEPDRNGAVVLPVGTTLEQGERELIQKTLASVNNNKTRAAAILGTTPKTLHNKARRWRSEAAQMAAHAAEE